MSGITAAQSISTPSVDVILPAFNGARVIRKALDSALSQSVPLRVIVVDDGSNDDSADIARSYGHPVTVITQQNRGVSGARNTGLMAAQAPYVALLDQDDIWQPGKIARQVELIETNPDVGLVFTDMCLQRDDGTVVEDGFLHSTPEYAALRGSRIGANALLLREGLGQAIVRFNFISPSTALVRRDALLDIGGFDESLRLCDDAECWMRLLRRWRGIAIEEQLVISLVWEGNASLKTDKLIRERLAIEEKVSAHPERYPVGASDHFRRERPVSHYRLGVIALNGGEAGRARSFFARSLHDRMGFSALLGWFATFLPTPVFRSLLHVKRAAGIRWAIRTR